mmetsp:Transcript_60063/g.137704  ORF Transcript_60063/g.137704 Transcript_60063/m.137704 type:complete len:212 (+) Transcript_60063:1298-1933(+)
MEHPDELFHHDGDLPVHLGARLVAHEESRERLQRRDLQREVEWSDHRHAAKRHADAGRRLAHMVAGDTERAREVAHLVARVVLHELAHDGWLACALRSRLRHNALDQPREEARYVWLRQLACAVGHHGAKHVVSVHVLDGVVQPRARAASHALDERLHFCDGCVRHADEPIAVQWVDHNVLSSCIHPLAVDEVATNGGRRCAHRFWIDRCP